MGFNSAFKGLSPSITRSDAHIFLFSYKDVGRNIH